MKNFLRNTGAIFIGCIIAFILLEIILRCYNPFEFRQQGDTIVLPANARYEIKNTQFLSLDSVIVHTKNSLGFRGEEKPVDFENRISVITVGGSTTECFYISDGKDWSALLSNKLKSDLPTIWINNAGMDGHSTFGHQILLHDHLSKIKPNYVTFLVGVNDVGRTDLDESTGPEHKGWKGFVKKHSTVVGLIVNLKRNYEARKRGINHNPTDLKSCEQLDSLDLAGIQDQVDFHKKQLAGKYKNRLRVLIDSCRALGIRPILITQPALIGAGGDDLTGVDLERIKRWDPLGGKAFWLTLEVYNDVTRTLAIEKGVHLIDLARQMPKSSRYFYDCEHFTVSGCEMVAQILYEDLKEYLQTD